MEPPATKRRIFDAKKPFRPAVGADFPVGETPAIEARTRGFLARYLTLAIGIAVLVTGVIGLRTGDYRALAAVWIVTGPIVGAVVNHYFGSSRKDSE